MARATELGRGHGRSVAASLRQRPAATVGRRLSALVWLALGGGVLYFLLPQLGTVGDALHVLPTVEPAWVVAAGYLVALRFGAATLSLRAAAGRPLPFGPTLLVQISSSFIGRLPPEGIGWLVLNQRFLERSGMTRSAAFAAIALRLAAGGVTRVGAMVAVAALVGASGVLRVEAPHPSWYAFAGGAIVLAIALGLRARRARRLAPVASAARTFLAVLHEPARAAALLAASAVATLAYALVLTTSVAAVGVDVPVLEVIAVYLGGTAVASLSPTPGNLGAIEVALSAGLTAVGVPSAAAVGAVLVYRLLTFWLPLVPGFVAFRYLQSREHI